MNVPSTYRVICSNSGQNGAPMQPLLHVPARIQSLGPVAWGGLRSLAIHRVLECREGCVVCLGAVGKYTVPVLWDKKEKTIVSNESSEIMRMFNRSVQ